jgi:filamentous hemagglutinin family protein
MPRITLLTPLLLLSAALLLAPLAIAGPTGGSGTPGVVISRNGGVWTIVAPDGSIINWNSFDIGRNQMVQFIQGGDIARVLNRITGPGGTTIDGTVTADGIVYIVNPAGVVFGPNAVIDAGGIYAAAGNISDEDFQNGVDRFTNLQGDVVNEGRITARDVNLIGQYVANFGQVSGTGGGYITMLAGDEVLIQRVGERIVVRIDGVRLTDRARPHDGLASPPGATARAGVLNDGAADNAGGGIVLGAGDHYALAIHNLGEVRAAAGEVQAVAASGLVSNVGTMSVDAASGDAGRVVLQGPKVENNGLISADAPDGAAGEIQLDATSGLKVQIGSTTSARGADGSGEIIARTSGGPLALGGIVDTSGTAWFDAPLIAVVRTTITADVRQRYRGPVRVLLDSSMLGGTVRFLDRVNGTTTAPGGLTMRGMVRFDGTVGALTPLQFIDVDGSTTFGGGLVRTVDFQRYLGDVTLSLDTTVESTGDALVRFGGAVDGRHALVVRTAGVTRFDGPIGGTRALTRLVTGDDGLTRLGGDVNAGIIILRDDASLDSDVRLSGDRAELARVSGNDFGLTVNGRHTLFGGPLRGLSHLSTDATGTTEISGGLVRAREIRFGDVVRLLADLSIDGNRVELAGPVDGPYELDLNAQRWARFGDDVGGRAGPSGTSS